MNLSKKKKKNCNDDKSIIDQCNFVSDFTFSFPLNLVLRYVEMVKIIIFKKLEHPMQLNCHGEK